MDGMMNFNDLKALQELINPPNDDSDSDTDISQQGLRKLGPGDIGPLKESPSSSSTNLTGPHAPLKSEGDEIWHSSEATASSSAELLDPRQVPEYEIKFKQSVTSEDIFLGMGFKTPGSASCEWITVLVKLPGESVKNVELTVESEFFDIRSPKYRLYLPTPHSIDPNNSSAKWHNDTDTLELTLKLVREFDGINF
ncbi:dynein axonemal assembly factor 6 [Microplitis mediator]|uniref:dynein axonemal assembly factor 6 n=1 Tax=Microplitis mediator TaxID=375433 RepID=UPI0025573505|nr:dynein axonemal assembly factor 6 [Microplitis mediator]